MQIQIPKKIHNAIKKTKRTLCLYGGRGGGKSESVARILLYEGDKSPKRILCCREYQNSIADSVHSLLRDTILEYELDNYKVTDKYIKHANGTEFLFRGLKKETVGSIKSLNKISICWVEEAQYITRKSLDILIPTIREDNSKIIFTMNPTNEDDPVYEDYIKQDRPDTIKCLVNYIDNKWFPNVSREEMEWDRINDPDKYEHIWQGKCVKHSQAQVFYGKWGVEDFEKFEIKDGKEEKIFPDKNTFFYQGADWGFSQDPLAFIRCFVIDRKLYICDELYGVGIDIDFIPGRFQEIHESDKFPITADSARPDTINYVKRHGFPLIRKSIKGKGSVEDGIAFLRGFEKIIIHPRCKHTIDEFRLYQYQVDPKTEAISNKLEDKNNHCIDALRYAVEELMRLRKVIAVKGIAR